MCCVYSFTDTDTVLNRVCAWTIESVVRAYAQGGNAEVLKFFGSREGILSLEVLESLITKDSCVDGCPDVAFLFSRLVKVFLSMPTHDASKALSPFTNNASMHIRPDTGRSSPEQRRRACNNSTITIAAAVTTATTNNSDTCNNSGNDEDEDDKGDYDAHLFFPSAELIETFNKESSMLAQARLYADRPEGAMPWRKLPTVFSAILKSFQHRLAGQADNRTGTGDSPHIMPSSFSAQAQSLQQPQPFMLNKKSNRAQYQYQQQQYQQRQQVPTSLFGSICVHMLNVLEKLLFGPGTLTGFLGKPHAVDPLIQVLGMDYAMAGSELYVVHRQLVRTLGSLMVGSAQTVDGIVLLSGHRVIEALVDVLRGDSLPSGVRMEIIQLVAHVLCLSSRLCNNLVYAFKECGGYNVLLDFFLSKECNEGPLEKRRLVKLYCHFLFVMPSPQHTGTAAGSSFDKCVVVENFDGVKLVLDAFVRTTDEDLRTELLTAIQAIFRLQIKSMSRNRGSGWIRRHEANPFIALLSKFDELSLANKKQILPVLDDVIITGGLSPEELQCYCSKLLQDKPPSTIILFMEHFSKLLENGHLLRAQLVKAGILDVLASYFVDPCKIKCASMLEDPEELNAALGLIGNDGYESDETSEDSDGSEAETDAEAPNEHNKEKEEENNDEENAAAAATTHANEASIHRVLHWISASAFKLLAAIIKNNEDIERRLKERSDFKALFTLLSLPDTREGALSIITIIAIQFPEPKDMMMQNIISTINATLDASPSGTEVPLDKLSLWECT